MENYISIDKNMIVYFGTDAQEMTWHDVRKPLFPSASLGYNRSNQFRCRQTAPGIGRRTRTLFYRFPLHRHQGDHEQGHALFAHASDLLLGL